MLGILGWTYNDIWPLTYKSLIVAYEAKLINDWHHTSAISAHVYNLSVLVINMLSKSKAKTKSAAEMHPFLEKKPRGLKINKDNFMDLQMIGCLMTRGK